MALCIVVFSLEITVIKFLEILKMLNLKKSCMNSFARMKFFVVCSAVGLMVLLPLNCSVSSGQSPSFRSMDSLTISNIPKGSNRYGHQKHCDLYLFRYISNIRSVPQALGALCIVVYYIICGYISASHGKHFLLSPHTHIYIYVRIYTCVKLTIYCICIFW